MRGRQQMQVTLNLSVGFRPENKMPVVPHQAVRSDSDVGMTLRPSHQPEKFLEISRVVEQVLFVVPTIDDVMNGTGWQKT